MQHLLILSGTFYNGHRWQRSSTLRPWLSLDSGARVAPWRSDCVPVATVTAVTRGLSADAVRPGPEEPPRTVRAPRLGCGNRLSGWHRAGWHGTVAAPAGGADLGPAGDGRGNGRVHWHGPSDERSPAVGPRPPKRPGNAGWQHARL